MPTGIKEGLGQERVHKRGKQGKRWRQCEKRKSPKTPRMPSTTKALAQLKLFFWTKNVRLKAESWG